MAAANTEANEIIEGFFLQIKMFERLLSRPNISIEVEVLEEWNQQLTELCKIIPDSSIETLEELNQRLKGLYKNVQDNPLIAADVKATFLEISTVQQEIDSFIAKIYDEQDKIKSERYSPRFHQPPPAEVSPSEQQSQYTPPELK